MTEILRVEYTPSQIHTGDSVTFKVVIKDSLHTDLLYEWYFRKYPLVQANEPYTKALIDLSPGEYGFFVAISRPNSQTQNVVKSFNITVLP